MLFLFKNRISFILYSYVSQYLNEKSFLFKYEWIILMSNSIIHPKGYSFLLFFIQSMGSLWDTLMNIIRKPHLKLHCIIIIFAFTSMLKNFSGSVMIWNARGRNTKRNMSHCGYVFWYTKLSFDITLFSCWKLHRDLCIVASSSFFNDEIKMNSLWRMIRHTYSSIVKDLTVIYIL